MLRSSRGPQCSRITTGRVLAGGDRQTRRPSAKPRDDPSSSVERGSLAHGLRQIIQGRVSPVPAVKEDDQRLRVELLAVKPLVRPPPVVALGRNTQTIGTVVDAILIVIGDAQPDGAAAGGEADLLDARVVGLAAGDGQSAAQTGARCNGLRVGHSSADMTEADSGALTPAETGQTFARA